MPQMSEISFLSSYTYFFLPMLSFMLMKRMLFMNQNMIVKNVYSKSFFTFYCMI